MSSVQGPNNAVREATVDRLPTATPGAPFEGSALPESEGVTAVFRQPLRNFADRPVEAVSYNDLNNLHDKLPGGLSRAGWEFSPDQTFRERHGTLSVEDLQEFSEKYLSQTAAEFVATIDRVVDTLISQNTLVNKNGSAITREDLPEIGAAYRSSATRAEVGPVMLTIYKALRSEGYSHRDLVA